MDINDLVKKIIQYLYKKIENDEQLNENDIKLFEIVSKY